MTGAPAVVLLSGGLDSATVLAIARRMGFLAHALSFSYGQIHAVELEAARSVAAAGGAVRHETLDIDLRKFGGSALTGDGLVPKHATPDDVEDGIPATYVPARNTVFLSLALAWAEALGARDLFIGVNAIDYSGYPDCRPAFIEAFERLANVATKVGVEAPPGAPAIRVHAPLIDMTKAEVIRTGLDLGVDYAITTSCYDPKSNGAPCGQCDSCHLRAAGFARLGIDDPRAIRFLGR